MNMERKLASFESMELKFAGEEMRFSGYASVFGGIDSYGDTIQKGAYERTLTQRSRPIMMLRNHYGSPIGKYLNMYEDDKGLFVEGELTPGHSAALDTYASLKHGAISGLSIGFYTKAFEQLDEGRRLLKEIELIEISVVDQPADLNAQIVTIKSALEKASSIREIENCLRDSGGFSRNDATLLVSRIKSLVQGELASEEKAKRELAELFQRFQSPKT